MGDFTPHAAARVRDGIDFTTYHTLTCKETTATALSGIGYSLSMERVFYEF